MHVHIKEIDHEEEETARARGLEKEAGGGGGASICALTHALQSCCAHSHAQIQASSFQAQAYSQSWWTPEGWQ